MSTRTIPTTRAAPQTSDVPYLPGLDGMRALAVMAVMVYHANPSWLAGGFLGVEVFFVISGYLITLLLIGEHERSGCVDLGGFWARRARRLLPALFTVLFGVTVYTALFRREALGQLRGDVLAALAYVSNWYQIWVGQGYTAAGDFAPLRHLWSLAVEEQFYLLWPLVMIALLRLGRRRAPEVSVTLLVVALALTGVVGTLYHEGPIGSCATTPDAYWHVAGRCISKTDFLYLSTPTRLTGLLFGGAFAMVWRPAAVMRGPFRRRGATLDAVAVAGFAGLAALCWYVHVVTPEGADPWLFRGGFLATGVATLAIIAAVSHQRSATGVLLGSAVLVWIGRRSYGLYLYHWVIFQGIRRVAGNTLSIGQFAAAAVASVVVAELSYRLIEMPVRRRTVRTTWLRFRCAGSDVQRRALAGVAVALTILMTFAGARLATAGVEPNEIAAAQEEGRRWTGDPLATTTWPARPTVAAAARTSTTAAVTSATTTPLTSAVSADEAAPEPTAAPAPTSLPAPTSAPPSAPETQPPPPPPPDPCTTTPIGLYALGDSVMLGAAGGLHAAGFCVDAVESRSFTDGLDQVIHLHAEGRLGGVVVVALGTNGPIGSADLGRMIDELAGVPVVVVLTTKADRSYVASNNSKLRALPLRYANVRVVDWAAAATACPGRCFYDDGIHLRPDGRAFYAQQILAATA